MKTVVEGGYSVQRIENCPEKTLAMVGSAASSDVSFETWTEVLSVCKVVLLH